MDDRVRAAFLFATPEPLEDGSHWTAGFLEWDPYRHVSLTMDVSLVHADGRVEHFEHTLTVPARYVDAGGDVIAPPPAAACRVGAPASSCACSASPSPPADRGDPARSVGALEWTPFDTASARHALRLSFA